MWCIGGVLVKIIIYCELCGKEYELEVGKEWVGLISCPHDVSHHILKEVIDDGGEHFKCHR